MASGLKMKPATGEQKFSEIIDAFSRNPRVTQGGHGFGSEALKIDGKIFAMLSSKKHLVVKLSRQRVEEFVSAGVGERFEPRPGKLMKEWLVITAAQADWAALAKEGCDFVGGSKS